MKAGDWIYLKNDPRSPMTPMQIVEDRGNLGPSGTRIFRIAIGDICSTLEVCEDQIEVRDPHHDCEICNLHDRIDRTIFDRDPDEMEMLIRDLSNRLDHAELYLHGSGLENDELRAKLVAQGG